MMMFFFQAEDGIRDYKVTGVQTCALPIYGSNFCRTTRKPRSSRSVPSEAAARPFPKELTTPPVTKIYFIARFSVLRERVFAPALLRPAAYRCRAILVL